ncbi:MAG: serine/threonine protein kinase, partial [Myxococcaceae bacterium]|nr:serine/threonine protein kinase [Myxococcaceae bacterium]
MGTIYRAFDRVHERYVAYKRLSIEDESLRLRMTALFQSEYNTLAQLLHPRIVEAYEYGVDPHGPYYTMELLSGSDLAVSAPLPIECACLAVRDIASALGLLHARRLIHRDVTPVNIRMTADGHAKLLDFGALAEFGTQTQVVGTPAFIAPECLSAASLDQRTDLYSLGAVLYFALTGEPAIRARSLEELRSAWAKEVVPPSQLRPDVPVALDELVISLLQHDPLARPQ